MFVLSLNTFNYYLSWLLDLFESNKYFLASTKRLSKNYPDIYMTSSDVTFLPSFVDSFQFFYRQNFDFFFLLFFDEKHIVIFWLMEKVDLT